MRAHPFTVQVCLVLLTACTAAAGCSVDDAGGGWSFEDVRIDTGGPDAVHRAPSDGHSADADVRDARGLPDAWSPRCAPSATRNSSLEQCEGQLPGRMVLAFDEKPVGTDFTSQYDYALSLGPTGCPRIGYASEHNRTIHFRRWNGTQWEHEQTKPEIPGFGQVEFDAAGRPRAVTLDEGRLHYATRDESGQWQSEDIIEVSDLAGFEESSFVYRLQLGFDCSGEPVVGVAEGSAEGPEGLVYLERVNGKWGQELVEEDGGFRIYDAHDYQPDWLVIDPQGRPHFFGVLFRYGGPQSIVHIERVGASTAPSDRWADQEFFPGEHDQDLGGSAWLAFDHAEKPHILFADDDMEGASDFRRTESGWSREPEPVIPNAHTVGPLTSSPTGDLYFFYATLSDDAEGGYLRYARWDGATWTRKVAAPMPELDSDWHRKLRVAVDWQSGVAHIIAIDSKYHAHSRSTSYSDAVYFHVSLDE